MKITVNFGLSNSLTREVPDGTTVGQILSNSNWMTTLGYGENVVAKIDGVTQSNDKRLVDGDEVDLEVRANTKA